MRSMPSDAVRIRPAHKNDAGAAAPLMYQALDDIAYMLTAANSEADVLAHLASFFQAEDNRLSYQNTLIAEVDGQVAGLVIIYHGRDAADLDRPLVERLRSLRNDPQASLDKEAAEDEFYIDTLSVFPQFGGRGIGSALLQAVEQLARQRDYNKLSLNVDVENERAYRLYQRLGYQSAKIITLYAHPYQHMLKYLS